MKKVIFLSTVAVILMSFAGSRNSDKASRKEQLYSRADCTYIDSKGNAQPGTKCVASPVMLGCSGSLPCEPGLLE